MEQQVQFILSLFPKLAKLLTKPSTYYILLIAGLGYWIYSSKAEYGELKTEYRKEDSLHVVHVAVLQYKIDNKDCAGEIRNYMELLKELRSDLDIKTTSAEKSLKVEQQRTDELEKTYQLLKKE